MYIYILLTLSNASLVDLSMQDTTRLSSCLRLNAAKVASMTRSLSRLSFQLRVNKSIPNEPN